MNNLKRKKQGTRTLIKRSISMFVIAIMLIAGTPASINPMVIVSEAASYNVNSAVAYARKYAYNYNPNYTSYEYVNGGVDCANFVSQCLEAGGIKRDGTWYPDSYAWVNCNGMISYFSSLGYKVIYNPTASQILPGNPVFTASYHVMICTGKQSDGTPLLSGHTNNRLDYPVYSYYCTIMINTGDSTAPTISDASVSNITSEGYTVSCKVTDNNGVGEVKMPTWTTKNDQDDLIWHTATLSRSADGKSATATFNVNISDHNYEAGDYITHIYAYDNSGNSSCFACSTVSVPVPQIAENIPVLSISGHVQDIGWQGAVSNEQVVGTTGKSLRLEALKIDFKSKPCNGNISYRGYVENTGWQNWQSAGGTIGTTGKGLRLEALQIKLTGELEQKYDIYYRSHVQYIGWQKWVCNGEMSGTTGTSSRIEAVQIKIVPKTNIVPDTTVENTTESSNTDNTAAGKENTSENTSENTPATTEIPNDEFEDDSWDDIFENEDNEETENSIYDLIAELPISSKGLELITSLIKKENKDKAGTTVKTDENKEYTVSGAVYRINGKSSVTYVRKAKSSASVTIPATVKINGKSYKVTEIDSNAFKNDGKITKLVIGKNVTTIGKNAFYKCSKLKTITIKSKNLKNVGAKAIYGINKKATIKVPTSKLKEYKKLLSTSTGFVKTMKIKKGA